MVTSDIVARNLTRIREEIRLGCTASGQDPRVIRLIAVTKTQDHTVLEILRGLGIRDFGENRIEHLTDMRLSAAPGDTWHFIGRVQSRQLPSVAEHCSVVHSLCDEGHITKLARAGQAIGKRLQVFIQVNVSGESAKAGVAPESIGALVQVATATGGLEVIGLMTMAPDVRLGTSSDAVRACFKELRSLAQRQSLHRLSMGMSGDYRIAVEEGATDLRIGSALFQD